MLDQQLPLGSWNLEKKTYFKTSVVLIAIYFQRKVDAINFFRGLTYTGKGLRKAILDFQQSPRFNNSNHNKIICALQRKTCEFKNFFLVFVQKLNKTTVSHEHARC